MSYEHKMILPPWVETRAGGRRIEFGAPVAGGLVAIDGRSVGPPRWPATRAPLERVKALPVAVAGPYGTPRVWPHADGYCYYREWDCGGVDETRRHVAHWALRACADDLGLGPTTLRWFGSEDEDDWRRALGLGGRSWKAWVDKPGLRGLFPHDAPHEVWIRADGGAPRDLWRTVAHELRHRAQFVARGRADDDRDRCERDAEQYAAACVEWFDAATRDGRAA